MPGLQLPTGSSTNEEPTSTKMTTTMTPMNPPGMTRDPMTTIRTGHRILRAIPRPKAPAPQTPMMTIHLPEMTSPANGSISESSLVNRFAEKDQVLFDGSVAWASRPCVLTKSVLLTGVWHHGYKGHIACDLSGIVTDYRFTTVKEHDSRQIDDLTLHEQKAVVADSEYSSAAWRVELRGRGVLDGICYKRNRGQAILYD